MSQYHCPECKVPTNVIDTRPTYQRLRRRRKCPSEHRFSTVEVPLTVGEEIKKLLGWIAGQEQSQKLEALTYVEQQVDHIIFGIPPPDEPDTEP